MWKKDNFFCKCCNSKQSEKKLFLSLLDLKILAVRLFTKHVSSIKIIIQPILKNLQLPMSQLLYDRN